MAICIAPVSLMALLHIKHHVKTCVEVITAVRGDQLRVHNIAILALDLTRFNKIAT